MIPSDEKRVILWLLSVIVFLFVAFYIIVFLTRSESPFVMMRFDVSKDLKVTKMLYDDVAEPIPTEYMLIRGNYTIKLIVSDFGGIPKAFLSFIGKSKSPEMTGQYITKSYRENDSYIYSPPDIDMHVLDFAVLDEHGIVIGNESLPYKVVPAGIHYSYDLL